MHKKEKPGVSIIVLTYNEAHHLEKLLSTFANNNGYEPIEFIIVDHASQDHTNDIIKKWSKKIPIVHLNRDESYSFAASNNFGAEKAKYPVLLFMSNKVVYNNDVLPLAVAQLQDENIGVVGIRLDDDPSSLPPGKVPSVQHAGIKLSWDEKKQCYSPYYLKLSSIEEAKQVKSGLYPAVTGAFLLCRKSDYEVVGGFYENNNWYYEDIDYCLQIKNLLSKSCCCVNELSLRYKVDQYRDNIIDYSNINCHNNYILNQRINNSFSSKSKYNTRTGDSSKLEQLKYSFSSNDYNTKTVPSTSKIKCLGGKRYLAFSHNLSSNEGAPRSLQELLLGLKKKKNISPIVLSPYDGDLCSIYEENDIPVIISKIFTSPFASKNINTNNLKQLSNELNILIKDYAIYGLISNTVVGFHLISIAKQIGIPSTWIIRESEEPQKWFSKLEHEMRLIFKDSFKLANNVIFVSSATRNMWHSNLDFNYNKSVTIPNGIDLERFDLIQSFDRDNLRQSLGIKSDEIVLLSVGTICERKNQLQLIEALQMLPDEDVNKIKIIFVGRRCDGSRANNYYKKIKNKVNNNYKTKCRTIFVNETPNISKYYYLSDAFVLTSFYESYPRVIIEAMLYSLPIIANPIFGVKEQTDNYINALYYDINNTNSLAGRIKEILQPTIREKLSAGSIKLFQQIPKYNEMLNCYNNVISSTIQISKSYNNWLIEAEDKHIKLQKRECAEDIKLINNLPLISIVVPVYKPKLELLKKMVASIYNQTYHYWQLCIADDATPDQEIQSYLKNLASKDHRVFIHLRSVNGHISKCLNSALELANGSYFIQVDQDDMLAENALYELVDNILKYPELDMVYSDEDKIDILDRRYDPYFKTGFSLELLYTHNYMTHLSAYRTSLVKKIGGYRSEYDGAQDLDLNLRVLEEIKPENIRHIQKILYHWRAIPGSTAFSYKHKPYQGISGRLAVQDHLTRKGIKAKVTSAHKPNYRKINYEMTEPLPHVTIIIPTKNNIALLKKCIDSILQKTTYPNYDVLIGDNNSNDPATIKCLNNLKSISNINILQYPHPFNFSAMNNYLAKHANGDFICFLNDDTTIISPHWLSNMISYTTHKDVGAVGAKLYYQNNTIQHCGIILGIGKIAQSLYRFLPRKHDGYKSRAVLPQDISAVTGACMLVRRNVFNKCNGFNEILAINYNDVDLCLRISNLGYRIIFTPYSELYHYESASRKDPKSDKDLKQIYSEIEYMKTHWHNRITNDPFKNQNIEYEANQSSQKATVFKLINEI